MTSCCGHFPLSFILLLAPNLEPFLILHLTARSRLLVNFSLLPPRTNEDLVPLFEDYSSRWFMEDMVLRISFFIDSFYALAY